MQPRICQSKKPPSFKAGGPCVRSRDSDHSGRARDDREQSEWLLPETGRMCTWLNQGHKLGDTGWEGHRRARERPSEVGGGRLDSLLGDQAVPSRPAAFTVTWKGPRRPRVPRRPPPRILGIVRPPLSSRGDHTSCQWHCLSRGPPPGETCEGSHATSDTTAQ